MDRDPNQQSRPMAMGMPVNARDDARVAHSLQMSHNPEVRHSSPDDARDESSMNLGNGHEGMKPMKRACNDCRQQKLRCDVVQSPFAPCSRCRKLGKQCTVDTLFKRVGRRDKYAEMQREIEELRWKLRRQTQGAGIALPPQPQQDNGDVADPANPRPTLTRELGHFTLSGELLEDLFSKFFVLYNPLLPFLDPSQGPDHYFGLSPLLGWTVVMVAARRFAREPSLHKSLTPDYVRFLWSTISDVPQNYHVVKALALICYWPLPTDRDFKDLTPQLSGLMMQIALQNMLHLDVQSQAPFRGELSPADHRDRLMTWAACNIVAESTSTTLGLPPNTVYEGVLSSDFTYLSTHQLPSDLVGQLRIAQFLNTTTKNLYCNKSEPNGLVPEATRPQTLENLRALYGRLEIALADHMSMVTQLHLHAANVHLLAFAFFLTPGADQTTALAHLYNAVCAFQQLVMNHETSTGALFGHCSNFIAQTIISSTFSLVKIFNSSFDNQMDTQQGKALFNGIILAIRGMSIGNDLASRVAARVPLMWRALGAGSQFSNKPDTLLQIQFRMGVSHIYDLHFAWREQLKAKGATPEAAMTLADGTVSTPNGPFAGLDYDERILYDSMDWVFGDWSGLPLGSYDRSYVGRLA